MGFFGLIRWGLILQAIALIHFVRRRPDFFWLWIIIFFGPLGAVAYMALEMVPDLNLLRSSLNRFSRRRRIAALEALVRENPALGNVEELADLLLEERQFARARGLYDKVIGPRNDSLDPHYRRGIAALELGDAPAAVADLDLVVAQDPKYDFNRAIGLLAHAHAKAGHAAQAEATFTRAIDVSTLSETQFNYATFLAAQGRTADARQLTTAMLARKPAIPRYLQRQERPWFRKAAALLKSLPR